MFVVLPPVDGVLPRLDNKLAYGEFPVLDEVRVDSKLSMELPPAFGKEVDGKALFSKSVAGVGRFMRDSIF